MGLRTAMNAYICNARMLSGPSVSAKTASGPLSGPLRTLAKCAQCVLGTQGVDFLGRGRVQWWCARPGVCEKGFPLPAGVRVGS